MSDQSERPSPVHSGNNYYGQTYTPGQATPVRPWQRPAVLPLTRRTSKKQQILAMLLYSLVSILTLVWCLFTITFNIDNHPNGSFAWVFWFQVMMLICVLAPATTLLCAVLFGSWRGALVSCISIYGSIQIMQLLNNHFWPDMSLGSFWFLIPVGIVTLLVGLSYDLRKYVGAPLNVFVLIAGAFVLIVVLFFMALANAAPDPNGDYDAGAFGAAMLACGVLFIILPSWVLLTLSVDKIIQKVLS